MEEEEILASLSPFLFCQHAHSPLLAREELSHSKPSTSMSKKIYQATGCYSKVLSMDSSRKRNAKWVSRGFISASECFSCANKVNHKIRGSRVSILCKDQCNYKPLKGERRLALNNIEDIE